MIRTCPRCWGTRKEPSAATLSIERCHGCDGLGWILVSRYLR